MSRLASIQILLQRQENKIANIWLPRTCDASDKLVLTPWWWYESLCMQKKLESRDLYRGQQACVEIIRCTPRTKKPHQQISKKKELELKRSTPSFAVGAYMSWAEDLQVSRQWQLYAVARDTCCLKGYFDKLRIELVTGRGKTAILLETQNKRVQ